MLNSSWGFKWLIQVKLLVIESNENLSSSSPSGFGNDFLIALEVSLNCESAETDFVRDDCRSNCG